MIYFSYIVRGVGSILYKMSFSNHGALQWVWTKYSATFVPHEYYGDTYEVDPKLSGWVWAKGSLHFKFCYDLCIQLKYLAKSWYSMLACHKLWSKIYVLKVYFTLTFQKPTIMKVDSTNFKFTSMDVHYVIRRNSFANIVIHLISCNLNMNHYYRFEL